ncbi:hypothetical protein DEA98_27800 [Brucella pseudogrignonensis]|nr:hypothetical protein [Brucella pseudogrignonensis]
MDSDHHYPIQYFHGAVVRAGRPTANWYNSRQFAIRRFGAKIIGFCRFLVGCLRRLSDENTQPLSQRFVFYG